MTMKERLSDIVAAYNAGIASESDVEAVMLKVVDEKNVLLVLDTLPPALAEKVRQWLVLPDLVERGCLTSNGMLSIPEQVVRAAAVVRRTLVG